MNDFKNRKNVTNGINLLHNILDDSISACFFDPQYRQVLDKMVYGNEGERQKKRTILPQMNNEFIESCLVRIEKILISSGYLFLWVDKFILCEGIHLQLFDKINFQEEKMNLVDMITWNKESFGMGYRSRRTAEHLLIYQKSPKMIKSWKDKSIRDVWSEKIEHPRLSHPHKKPEELINRLIQSVTNENDFVCDPCAGSYVVLNECLKTNRNFIGCDIVEELQFA